MSKAIELAEEMEGAVSETIYLTVMISKDFALANSAELRRLAAIEQKYLAIMAQEPVGYFIDTAPIGCESMWEQAAKESEITIALYLIKEKKEKMKILETPCGMIFYDGDENDVVN